MLLFVLFRDRWLSYLKNALKVYDILCFSFAHPFICSHLDGIKDS